MTTSDLSTVPARLRGNRQNYAGSQPPFTPIATDNDHAKADVA